MGETSQEILLFLNVETRGQPVAPTVASAAAEAGRGGRQKVRCSKGGASGGVWEADPTATWRSRRGRNAHSRRREELQRLARLAPGGGFAADFLVGGNLHSYSGRQRWGRVGNLNPNRKPRAVRLKTRRGVCRGGDERRRPFRESPPVDPLCKVAGSKVTKEDRGDEKI